MQSELVSKIKEIENELRLAQFGNRISPERKRHLQALLQRLTSDLGKLGLSEREIAENSIDTGRTNVKEGAQSHFVVPPRP